MLKYSLKDRQKITTFSEAHITQPKVNTCHQLRGNRVKIKQLSVTCVWQIKGTDRFFARKSCRQMRDFRRPPVVREMGLAGEGSHPRPDSWGTGKISLFVGFRKWIRCGSFHGILVPLPHPSCPYLFGRKCWVLKVKGSFLPNLRVFSLRFNSLGLRDALLFTLRDRVSLHVKKDRKYLLTSL